MTTLIFSDCFQTAWQILLGEFSLLLWKNSISINANVTIFVHFLALVDKIRMYISKIAGSANRKAVKPSTPV